MEFIKRNAPTILTWVGGIGVVATSVMAVKATPKALRILGEAKEEKGEDLTKLEVVKVAGPVYIPALAVGLSTIACIFGANILNQQAQASLISAYGLLDNSYKAYKNKVLELYGEDADTHVKEEISKDIYEETDISVDEEKELFFDFFSMRYFESTHDEVKDAKYNINRLLSIQDYCTVNDFYELLGLPPIESGERIGWSTGMNYEHYWQAWIDFDEEKVNMEDGLECTILTMRTEPAAGFDNY